MAETELIQPTQLYNLLNQTLRYAFISNPFYLLLFDVRSRQDYDEGHIIFAKRLKKDTNGNFILPYEADLECRWETVVYDGTFSDADNLQSDAVRAAKFLYANGSRKIVKILAGGFELFSRSYPFLRTTKTLYLPRELERFSTYPLEVIPNFMYLSSRKKAGDRKMHREMKITAHVNCDIDIDPIYEACPNVEELALCVGSEATDLVPVLHRSCDFLQKKRFNGDRVLLISDYSINRNVMFAIAYLIKYNGMSLQDAWKHLKDVCLPMQPSWHYMQQLAKFEADCRGRKQIRPLTEEEFYGKRMREFRIESQILSALPKND